MSILDIDLTREAVFAGEVDQNLKMVFDYRADRDDGSRTSILPGDKPANFVWGIIDASTSELSSVESPLKDEFEFAESLRLLGVRDIPTYEDYMAGETGCDRCGCDLHEFNRSRVSHFLCETCNEVLEADHNPYYNNLFDR